MRHLAPEQLVDVAEGAVAESAHPHLVSCDACRRGVAELRSVIADAAAAEVPEPSPLFWDHLSARVREAVALDGAAASPRWLLWNTWRSWRVVVPVAAALGALVAVVITTHRPAPADPVPHSAAAALPRLEPLGATDDPSLSLVRDLAMTLDLDEVTAEVPLSVHAGGLDEAVSDMSAGELQELQQLLKQELANSGRTSGA